jgi:hypothetical protein
MTVTSCSTVLLESRELLPPEWAALNAGALHTFNPGLTRSADGGWILAYRVVVNDGRRRIGICRLDRDFRVLPGSARALSDALTFRKPNDCPTVALEWFADPRLLRLQGKLFIYWNSGWHEPRNHQFLQELDERTLQPIGTARELLLTSSERRKLEKNWMPFESGGRVLVVYSVQPHRILTCDLAGAGDIACRHLAAVDWSTTDYPACHGGLRGGTPPQVVDGLLWSFSHSVHDGTGGYEYRAAAYAFSPEPPFAPVRVPLSPLQLHPAPLPARQFPRLNPAVGEVIYPCGACREGADWVVSWGLNDERCAVTVIPHAHVAASTTPTAAATPIPPRC